MPRPDSDFVEDNNLVADMDLALLEKALTVLVPLRHVAWGANMNNASIGAYGYGAALAQAAVFHAMDHLGIAQYLTRIGLVLADPSTLDAAKAAWQDSPEWQGLRKYVEDSFVIQDPVELHIAQNLVLDGLMYPLIFESFIKDNLNVPGGTALATLTRFMSEWFIETRKWVDATTKAIVAESSENQQIVQGWLDRLLPQAEAALLPIAKITHGDQAAAAVQSARATLDSRLKKSGL
ncbi:hypothetical protein [Castellaniella sp.]|uniref:hypothetical protein n=1 Tax=Castellaniella sp. TaxID=1955812 RepID=UPI002AFE343B|nr:hypothetical protein [Castellaniella sp.]